MKSAKWYLSKVRQAVTPLLPGAYLRHVLKKSAESYVEHNPTRNSYKFAAGAVLGVLALAASCLLCFYHLNPILEPLVGKFTSIFAFLGVCSYATLLGAEIGYLTAKYAIRLSSWIRSHTGEDKTGPNDPRMICSTHPEKYTVSAEKAAQKTAQTEEAQDAMRLLCQKKTKIKDTPETLLGGYTEEQKMNINSLNIAIKKLAEGENVTTLFQSQRGYDPEYIKAAINRFGGPL